MNELLLSALVMTPGVLVIWTISWQWRAHNQHRTNGGFPGMTDRDGPKLVLSRQLALWSIREGVIESARALLETDDPRQKFSALKQELQSLREREDGRYFGALHSAIGLLTEVGHLDEAAARIEEGLYFFRQKFWYEPLARTLCEYAKLQERQGDLDGALASLEESMPILRRRHQSQKYTEAVAMAARLLDRLGRTDDAARLAEANLALFKEHLAHSSYLEVLFETIHLLEDGGRVETVEALLKDGLQFFQRESGCVEERSRTMGELVRLLEEQERLDEAVTLLDAEMRALKGKTLREALGEMLRLLAKQGRTDEVVARCEEAVLSSRRLSRSDRIGFLGDLARQHEERGDWRTARSVYEEQLKVCRRLWLSRGRVECRRHTAEALGDLARVLDKMGRPDAAIEHQEERLGVLKKLRARDESATVRRDIERLRAARDKERDDVPRP